MRNPPCREHDRIELGMRAAMAIKAENSGLTYQRLAFLYDGNDWQAPKRRPFNGWRIEYDEDGMARRMTWAPFRWAADA